jgi:hypothetical protein
MTKKRHEEMLERMEANRDMHAAAFRTMVETCTSRKADPCPECKGEGSSECTHETCSVCLENIDLDDDVDNPICYIGGCRHTFHYVCLGMWTNHARTCPRCRNATENVFKYNNGTFSTCVIAKTTENRVFTNYDVEQYVHDDGEEDADMDEDDDDDSFIDDSEITDEDRHMAERLMMAMTGQVAGVVVPGPLPLGLGILAPVASAAPVRQERAALAWLGPESWHNHGAGARTGAPATVLDAAPSIPLFLQRKMNK